MGNRAMFEFVLSNRPYSQTDLAAFKLIVKEAAPRKEFVMFLESRGRSSNSRTMPRLRSPTW